MDLTLTKRGDYAVRAAICLARAYRTGGYRKIREVARDMDLPLPYTPQILNLLAKAGIAEARAGQQGGYRLRVAPEQVTLLDVVQAAEGPLRAAPPTIRRYMRASSRMRSCSSTARHCAHASSARPSV